MDHYGLIGISNRHCNITTSTLYSELRPMHFSQADLALVCFQIDNPISLKNIRESWLPEFKQYCPNTPYVCQKIVIFLNSSILQYNLKISISCLLIGLKVDIRKAAKADKNNNSTIISKEYAVTFANSIGAKVSIKKTFFVFKTFVHLLFRLTSNVRRNMRKVSTKFWKLYEITD